MGPIRTLEAHIPLWQIQIGVFSLQTLAPRKRNYGLSATVWTDKCSKILKMVSQLRDGVVWANTYNKFYPASPFGGLQGKRVWS